MNRDLAGCFVFRDQFAGGQYQSHHFHRVGFEQRVCFGAAEL